MGRPGEADLAESVSPEGRIRHAFKGKLLPRDTKRAPLRNRASWDLS